MNNKVNSAFHKKILKVYYAQNNILFSQVGKFLIHTHPPSIYNETLNIFSWNTALKASFSYFRSQMHTHKATGFVIAFCSIC